MLRLLAIAVLGLGTAACTGGGDDGDDVPPGVVDVRVPIPAPDPDYVDLVTPEVTIQPGEEKMFCLYVDNTLGEFAVRAMEALQGDYGHHIVLLTTIEPQPHGTLEDCTDQSTMWKFRSFVLPGNELPAGHGIRVPAGLQYVMQFHYVNVNPAPILVRDVARLEKIAVGAVTTWVTTLTTNSLRVELPAGPSREEFDCVIDQEVDLLLLGGHMHEAGSRFEISVGPSTDELTSMYLVDPWRPRYRDAPPVTLFFSAPRRVAAGTIVRTTCEWDNTTGEPLGFPAEMCAAFGYVAGRDTPIHCEPE